MSDFLLTYQLTRGRFDAAILPMNQSQLNFRANSDSLTPGEMALHLVGVEIWFAAQLTGADLHPDMEKLAKCATEGVVNEEAFPFSADEVTPGLITEALAAGRAAVEPLLTENSEEIRSVQIQSALGPIVDGAGAFARIAAHPFYHQGQIYTVASTPGFPS